MLNISFSQMPEVEGDFGTAVYEYEKIWSEEGERIVDTLENVTGLKFKDTRANVLVYEGVSYSGQSTKDPMRLRASYSADEKKGTFVHELGHRLLFGIKSDLGEHELLNLFLYDVWVELYGEGFANKMVEIERPRNKIYTNAWNFALGMTAEERKEKLQEILDNQKTSA